MSRSRLRPSRNTRPILDAVNILPNHIALEHEPDQPSGVLEEQLVVRKHLGEALDRRPHIELLEVPTPGLGDLAGDKVINVHPEGPEGGVGPLPLLLKIEIRWSSRISTSCCLDHGPSLRQITLLVAGR
jgi:hypothetical protein